MRPLDEIVAYCNKRTRSQEIADFPGALNGLQFSNNGEVSKIGAAVDAGLIPFQMAIDAGIDLLIVHHGMFWNAPERIVGSEFEKIRSLLEGNMAVYSCHLPLDAHPEIGNSACLAKKIGAKASGSFLPYEGNDIGLVCDWNQSRDSLRSALEDEFPRGIASIEFGSKAPKKICVVTGSGNSVVDQIESTGSDTLITGELKQHFYNVAQEQGINLYACGHYATETFGVDALAREVSSKFDLPYQFIATDCPL